MSGQDRCPDEETVALYALDALSPREREGIEAHLGACLACRARLARARAVGDALLVSAPRVEPPPDLEARILAEVRGERLRRGGGRMRWWAAVAAAVLVGANGWQAWRLATAQRQLAKAQALRREAWAEGRLAAELSGGERVRLRGTAAARDASATVRIVRQGNERIVLLTARGLPAVHAPEVYHLWLLHDGRRLSGGTFTVGSGGRGAMAARIPADVAFQAMGVTLEPSAATVRPLGPKVLAAELSS